MLAKMKKQAIAMVMVSLLIGVTACAQHSSTYKLDKAYEVLLNERGQPLRTFRGPISQDGYSDHLPIYVDMKSSQ